MSWGVGRGESVSVKHTRPAGGGLAGARRLTATHLWLIRAESTVTEGQPLEPDGELDVAAPDDVLDFKLGELGVKPEFLDDASVLPRGETRVVLGLGAGDDHLARGENERGRLGVSDTHDDGCESLAVSAGERCGLRLEADLVQERDWRRRWVCRNDE